MRQPPNPRVLRTANSPILSRAVIDMVLAATAMMMTITTRETRRMTMMIASVMEMKRQANAFSVSVSVSAREFLNVCVHGEGHVGGDLGTVDADDVDAHLVGPGRRGLLQALVQIVPVKEEYALVHVLVPAVVDGAEHELPVAGVDGPLEGDRVADLPSEPLRELPPRGEAFPVAEKGLLLVRGEDVFGIEGEVGSGLHGEIREKVLLVDVDAAEPVAGQTCVTPGIWAIFSLYERGREKVRETAFRVTRRLADDASTPTYQASITVRKRPKARMAMVMERMVSQARSLWRKAFLRSSLRRNIVEDALFEVPDDVGLSLPPWGRGSP